MRRARRRVVGALRITVAVCIGVVASSFVCVRPSLSLTRRIGRFTHVQDEGLPSRSGGRERSRVSLSAATKSGGRPIGSADAFQSTIFRPSSSAQQQWDVPMLVLYTAPWCGPCRLTNPVVMEVAKAFTANRLLVYEVCTDDLPDVTERAGVLSIPTIQLYYRGQLLDTIVGCVSKNVLAAAVCKILDDVGLNNDTNADNDNNYATHKNNDKTP